MIVKVNETNSSLYRDFFSQAYKYLESCETDTVKIIADEDRTGERTFTSIPQYFKYIEYFRDSPKSAMFLLKLPLDEGTLNIDANTRLIDVPASFAKTAIIQKDKVAETIVFTIDRFIDNIDLCNISHIYVQWSAPDGNGGVREWATPVTLIDRESISEKIKFGWTIDEEVTLYPGKVSFAVTFFIPDENKVGSVKYRLSTLPTSFEVKAALQPDINSNSVINRPSDALNAAIRNNRFGAEGVKDPKTPTFDASIGGLDLPGESILTGSGEGTLTLRAQALTSDEGIINYAWYFVPEKGGAYRYRCGTREITQDNSSTKYSIPFDPKVDTTLAKVDYDLLDTNSKKLFKLVDGSETIYELATATTSKVELFYNNIGTVGVAYEVVNEMTYPNDVYYVQISDGVWERYDGSPEHDLLPKYEKYTTFQVADSGKVVGEYYVEADNTIFPNTSFPQASNSCYLNGPEDIVILKDLEKNLFIEDNATYKRGDKIFEEEFDLIIDKDKYSRFESGTDENGRKYFTSIAVQTSVKIKRIPLELEVKTPENTGFVYDWYRSEVEGDKGNKIIGLSEPYAKISDVGWYKIEISANKNREYKYEKSTICRALHDPLAPTLTIVEYDENKKNETSSNGFWINAGQADEYYFIDGDVDTDISLVVNGAILSHTYTKETSLTSGAYQAGKYYYKDISGNYVLDESETFDSSKVYYSCTVNNQTNNKLYSDGIQYEWRIFDGTQYVPLRTDTHSNLVRAIKNPDFRDSADGFSSHPPQLFYHFDGQKAKIACFAINTLYTKDTLNESVAVSFEIN